MKIFSKILFLLVPLCSSSALLQSQECITKSYKKERKPLQQLKDAHLIVTFTPRQVTQAFAPGLSPVDITGSWKLRVLAPDFSVVAESNEFRLNAPPIKEQILKIKRVYRGVYIIEFVLTSFSSKTAISDAYEFVVLDEGNGTVQLVSKAAVTSIDFTNDASFVGGFIGPSQSFFRFTVDLP